MDITWQKMHLRLLRGRSYPELSRWSMNTIIFVLTRERKRSLKQIHRWEGHVKMESEMDVIASHRIPRWPAATRRQREAWNGCSQDPLGEVQPSITSFQRSVLQNKEDKFIVLVPHCGNYKISPNPKCSPKKVYSSYLKLAHHLLQSRVS